MREYSAYRIYADVVTTVVSFCFMPFVTYITSHYYNRLRRDYKFDFKILSSSHEIATMTNMQHPRLVNSYT